MDLWEAVGLALEALRTHRLRSLLTTLGVAIGVTAVIALVTIGQQARSSVVGELANLGPDLLWVLPGKAKEGQQAPTEEGRLTLTYEDALAIQEEGTAAREAAPILQTTADVSGGSRTTTTTVIGTTPNLLRIRNLQLAYGRFLSPSDFARRRRTVVLGDALARELYRTPQAAVGRRFILLGRAFEVIGVLRPEGQLLGVNLDDRAYIPFSTAQQLFRVEHASWLFVRAHDTTSVARARHEVERILLRRHRVKDFTVLTQSQLLSSLDAILRILTLALGAIAAISLVVGGIGIMNIMLVSVTERTREIGIRKAVGARFADILLQFLVEAMAISLLGGLAGMALGIGISWGVTNRLFSSPPTAATLIPTVVLATSFSILVGLGFGVYPAWRAARLDPIQALRYE
ncbi:MAG: ABC transporter permease [Armatimonadetes bacterium]|nr:ABC transporter permease [Armatimonadota bacterium]MDW8154469.1 ABC transporter permease [Armatimonadota bacterium]